MSRPLLFSLALLSLAAAAPPAQRRTPVVIAVERTSPAVVSVSVQTMVSQRRADWFFRDFSAPSRRLETVSQGSGVVIDPAGFVLTNYHVIAGGDGVKVELTDNRTLDAEVVGTAPDHDLAVLKVKSDKPLPHVPMGASTDLMIGEPVIAIGNPFGLSHTVTTGVVSAMHRSITTEDRTYADFIQVDAAINPGNSGGPLLNIEGELIGVNTAIYGKAQGIGFAIPIDKAKRIVNDLLKYGEVRRPYYGFDSQDLTPELAESLHTQKVGALVADVDPKGPSAGKLRAGDLVTELEGIHVASAEELRTRLGDYTAGSRVGLTVIHDGTPVQIELVPSALSGDEALRRLFTKVGIKVVEMAAADAKKSRLPVGMILIESVAVGSPAARIGLQKGDWVRAVNDERVLGLGTFGKAIARSYWRGQAILLIQRGRVWQQFAFDL